MIKKSIESLPWVESSHGCGQKRVLLSENETATNLTQVAIISLKAGEEGKEHMHWKIEEGFYVLKGELILQADGTNHILHAGDYLHLRMATIHNLKGNYRCGIAIDWVQNQRIVLFISAIKIYIVVQN